MSSLIQRMKKTSTIKESTTIDKSVYFNDVENSPTTIPALNVALSGGLTEGLRKGLTIVAGNSRHFKSLFCLIIAEAYLKKHSESAVLFLDSEFGSPTAYFESVGIDTSRVLHVPVLNIEQLKHELVCQLNALEKDDKLIVICDSIGNLASLKEIQNAEEGSESQDMTRARMMKSLGRIVTPLLTMKNVPMLAVGHVYEELKTYGKTILSGGTGLMLSADNVWFIGRQQDKDAGKDLVGYKFIINIEKSRHVKEKSKIPITVKFDGGLSKWSGLLEMALESGHVRKPSNGWYSRCNIETGELEEKKFREKDTDNSDFWLPVLTDKTFQKWVKDTYQVTNGKLISDEEIVSVYDNLDENNED